MDLHISICSGVLILHSGRHPCKTYLRVIYHYFSYAFSTIRFFLAIGTTYFFQINLQTEDKF